jgi:hypothetical protein
MRLASPQSAPAIGGTKRLQEGRACIRDRLWTIAQCELTKGILVSHINVASNFRWGAIEA